MSTPLGRFTIGDTGAVLTLNGHRTEHPTATPVDEDVTGVTREIRAVVAQRLTDEARRYEQRTGTPMPAGERAEVIRSAISDALDAYATAGMSASPARPPLHPLVESRVAQAVADSLLGAGGLEPLLRNPRVEEITANGCDVVFIRLDDGSIERVAAIADSDEDLVELVRRLAASSGVEERRLDRAAPMLNLQLPDGSRLNAVIAVAKRPAVSIRRHRYLTVTLDDLVGLGTLNVCLRELLTAAVHARLNLLIAGRTGAGKTTLLRGLASVIAPSERLVTIEDTFELGLDVDPVAHPNVVALQARDANIEGEGAIDLAALFRNTLRMVPDRIVVGEVRGDEVVPMLHAMSAGNDGSLATIHASTSAGVFRKLALYAAQSPQRLDQATTNLHIAEGLDLVVHLGFGPAGRRVVTSVREVVDADGVQVASNEILRPGPDGRAVTAAPASARLLDRLVQHGFDPELLHAPHAGWGLA